jgi:NitT/TauT family transport system ATP-binding protein
MTTPVAAQHIAGTSVVLRDVRREFAGGVRAVDGISLTIGPGEFVAFLGPSGCGKSTLLRMIAGLDRPTSGEVSVQSKSTDVEYDRHHRSDIAYVFQDAHLLPWRTVIRNAMLPLELMGVPANQQRESAMAMLEQVGLADFANHYPAELSGGMRMRVSLARALVTQPQLLLLDEPFAALDEITRQQLDEQLRHLWRLRAMTVLFVTHSINEAAFLAERAVVFTRRPARVVIDHEIHLPTERVNALRTESQFALEMKTLFDALEAGGSR